MNLFLHILLPILGPTLICEAYNILLVFPNLSRSHRTLAFGYAKHLLAAGHEVTIITPYPEEVPHPKLRQVDVSASLNIFRPEVFTIKAVMGNETMSNYIDLMKATLNLFLSYEEETIKNKNVQDLLDDKTIHFDVVLAEWFHSDVFAGFSTVYNCPLIWSSTTEAHWIVLSLIDESSNPAYSADMNSAAIPPFSFTQRLVQFAIQVTFKAVKFLYFSSRDKSKYEGLFGPHVANRGRELPPYEEVLYNGSLLFANSHPSYTQNIRLPSNCKEIGGYWIERKTDPLPKDLQQLMDNAKYGVIYFSMGSIWKSKDMPNSMKRDILRVFSELQQTVIWKLEEELTDLPKNVHTLKWAPQHSILAHSNCRLFITHGGILSMTETVFFGVPVIGIPVGYDQHLNIDRAVRKGYARKVNLVNDLADDLKLAVGDVLSNTSYRNTAKEISNIYHDRPVPPGAELVHWVEHVVRTRGAPHLRSPALMLPWYQKAHLDILAVIIFIPTFIIIIMKRLFKRNKNQFVDAKKTQ